MIRLRDAASGALVDLEAPPTGHVELLLIPVEGELLAFRLALIADVLDRVLALSGIQSVPVGPDTNEPPDLCLTAGQSGRDAPAAIQSRRRLHVADVRLEDLPLDRVARPSEIAGRDGAELALRYFALTAHYATPWKFSATGLAAAQVALDALLTRAARLAESGAAPVGLSPAALALDEQFATALANDLDTPAALAIVWTTIHSELPPPERRVLLSRFGDLLGLELSRALTPPTDELPAGALHLIEQRAAARQARDWTRSDELRSALAALGVEARDTRESSIYRRIDLGD